MSLTEYVDGLNAIEARVRPQVEAVGAEYWQLAEPSTDDLETLLEGVIVIRTEALEASRTLSPPAQVTDLHDLIFDWQATMIQAEEALANRAATSKDLTQVLQSAEADAYYAALGESSAVCSAAQAKLDATADRGVFADTPWVPGEMKEVVQAFLGCYPYPENLEDFFSTPPTTDSP
jgi:hypothetical protein